MEWRTKSHSVTLRSLTHVFLSGGAANESAKKSPLHDLLVSRIDIGGQTFLSYKALPIDVGESRRSKIT
jgi:hypothetical protein